MKKIRIILPVLLILAMLTGITMSSAADNEQGGEAPPPTPLGPATVIDKDEVVYARLSSNGAPRDIYIVNHFTLAGGGVFTDRGAYSSVTNLTDLEPITMSDGTVTMQTIEDNYYYQGYYASSDLPWRYEIEYRLNGTKITPEMLAGAAGSLEIRLTSSKNGAVDDTFYNNYMQQITITLDNEKCSDIIAEGATEANAGKSRVLVYTILPKQDADIAITADVRDFSMAGIDISAMPFSMSVELPDVDVMLEDFSMLTDAIAELNDGVVKLLDGVREMASGASELKSGSSEFKSGLAELSANSAQITDASSQFRDALALLSSTLSQELAGVMEQYGAIPIVSGMMEQMNQLSAGVSELSRNYAVFHSGLVSYCNGIAALNGGYAELDSGIAEFNRGFGELTDGIEELSDGTSQLADETSDLPGRVKEEIDNLTSDYTGNVFEPVSFASGENDNIRFVQFVFKADGVAAPKTAHDAPPDAEPLTFLDRLIKLFKS